LKERGRMMGSVLFLLMFLIVALAAAFFISGFLVKRATFKVIETFYRQDAFDWNHARTIEELGLQPPDFLGRIMRIRDYKPQALRFLIEKGMIQRTPDGKLYLVEKQLDEGLRCKLNDLLPPNRRS
jgi:hypothetical protein